MDDLEDVFAALRLFRHRDWEVVVLHVVHPDEERLPDGHGLSLRGHGRRGPASIARRPRFARRIGERFAAHLATVRQFALAGGCDYRRVSTAVSYLQTLGGFLVERAG